MRINRNWMSKSRWLASFESGLGLLARETRSCPDASAGMWPEQANCASGSPTTPKPASAGVDADDYALVSVYAIAALGCCVMSTARTGASPETGPDPAVTASGRAPAC